MDIDPHSTTRGPKDDPTFFRDIVERASSIILKLDSHGIITYINDYGLEFFGYERDELIGRNAVGTIIPEVDSSGRDNRKMIADVLANEECTLTVGAGESLTTIPILKSASSIRIRGHDMILESFVDLSGEKKLEGERMRHAKLKTALELAGAASHELNQPLQIISGYADVLGCQVPDASEEAKKTVGEILAQVRRMGDILWKLTHLTSYETRDYAGSEQIVDLDKSSTGAEEE